VHCEWLHGGTALMMGEFVKGEDRSAITGDLCWALGEMPLPPSIAAGSF